MIQIVMRPVKAPVVNYEGLYSACAGGVELLRVRARNARHAEEKLMFCFRRELEGKTLDFDLERFRKEDDNGQD